MKYKKVENIGQGGFGIVDEVVDMEGTPFAQKTFHISQPHLFDAKATANVKQRFIREAKVQKGISHKNIVPVIDADLNADPPYYVMPKAISSLADDLKVDNTLGGKYLDALMDILSGLEELHRLGIFHRDLKPANVLKFNDDEDNEYYAIGDFGLMSVTHSSNVSTLTQTGMRMQSDMYTAPEIVVELKHATVQSDIYSVGCILHDFVGITSRIPCHEVKETTNAFSGILQKCTRKEKERRFKSVGALRDAILALGKVKVAAKTEKGATIFKLLTQEPNQLATQDWEVIVEFIEDQFPNEDSMSALSKLNIERIDFLLLNHKQLGERLGIVYAEWIRTTPFIFEECDGLANRLERFILSCELDVKSRGLMAILYMGTRHNRWYVERKFVGHLGKGMDENLAQRLALEIRVDEDLACKAYNHLKRSITFNLENLHPVVFETLSVVCK